MGCLTFPAAQSAHPHRANSIQVTWNILQFVPRSISLPKVEIASLFKALVTVHQPSDSERSSYVNNVHSSICGSGGEGGDDGSDDGSE